MFNNHLTRGWRCVCRCSSLPSKQNMCVVPTDSTKHVNEKILPKIDSSASVYLGTVTRYLNFFGPCSSEMRKDEHCMRRLPQLGLQLLAAQSNSFGEISYDDGHGRADVRAYCTQCLGRMRSYEPFLPKFVALQDVIVDLALRKYLNHSEAWWKLFLPPMTARRSCGVLMENSQFRGRRREDRYMSAITWLTLRRLLNKTSRSLLWLTSNIFCLTEGSTSFEQREAE